MISSFNACYYYICVYTPESQKATFNIFIQAGRCPQQSQYYPDTIPVPGPLCMPSEILHFNLPLPRAYSFPTCNSYLPPPPLLPLFILSSCYEHFFLFGWKFTSSQRPHYSLILKFLFLVCDSCFFTLAKGHLLHQSYNIHIVKPAHPSLTLR